jgi:hypothetical protein
MDQSNCSITEGMVDIDGRRLGLLGQVIKRDQKNKKAFENKAEGR